MTQSCEASPRTPPAREDLLRGLRADGARHEQAIRDLHAMLLRAARYEIMRRSAALTHVRGEDRDDLALQAADDAFVAVMSKLHDFRGESRFSTWVTELLDEIRSLIDSALTAHQREVLIALTIQGISIDVLADRLGSTRGALYKTLHDARRTLRSQLTAAGHDLEAISP